MKITRSVLSTIASIVLLIMAQSTFAAESLCHQGETTFFSCTVKGGKIVSLCGEGFTLDSYSNYVADFDSWLQYRFGLPEKIEISFPSRRRNSLEKFQGN